MSSNMLSNNLSICTLHSFKAHMKNIKKIITAILVTSGLTLSATFANATMILTLSSGENSVSIEDNGIGDTDSTVGIVHFSGGLGSWFANVTTGISNSPALEGQPAFLNLLSSDFSSRGAGTLTIILSDPNLINPFGTNLAARTSTGGITSGTVTVGSLLNGVALNNLGSFTGGVFSATGSSTINTTNGFNLANVITITSGEGGGFATVGVVTVVDPPANVPEPTTLGLLGLGLLGLGFVRRKSALA